MKYVSIAIDNKSHMTDILYTYGCTHENIAIGQKVRVPFNLGNRMKDGYVFEIADQPDKEYKNLKYVAEIEDDICLGKEAVDTCVWMRKRYLCRYIDAVNCFTPAGKKIQRKSADSKNRDPFEKFQEDQTPPPRLTDQQLTVLEPIKQAVRQKQHRRFLLHGVTGSGKTEVYMQTVGCCVDAGRNAIVLVPEIALTTQVIERFMGRFGKENIAVLHSKLTLRERYDQWIRIKSGQVKIVIGARSAVFAPLENIGAMILDEEHEGTYKSDMMPKYETVEVALKRIQAHGGILLLGSATPSVVSYRRAEEGIYEKLELTERYNRVALPEVKVVDMRRELREGNKSMFSQNLYDEMVKTLKEKQQIILFLNRRGYATFISCRECGYVVKCPECGISLTYHKDTGKASCHYCGYKEEPATICPKCGSRYIRYFGAGTEKVEEAVSQVFPEVETGRLDLDTTKKKGAIDKTLNAFKKGKLKILIGTQLVAKGLDFRNVGLVGIISADVTLNIPDFRAPERTFQLITQAAGRAGRGDKKGMVIIQSYTPDNYAVQMAAEQNYNGFYETEIQLRKYMGYPPYSDLIQVIFMDKEQEVAKAASENWYRQMAEILGEAEASNIFTPQEAPLNKIKDDYRYCLLIKCPKGRRKTYTEALSTLRLQMKVEKADYVVTIDMNPYSFI